MTRRFAAIDIGTVTCRMLVADVLDSGELRELRREYEITNLGEGVDATNRLKPEAIDRVAKTVSGYMRILDGMVDEDGAKPSVFAVATSASRDAENADEFKSRLSSIGVCINVIPGEEEAGLSFAGATSAFPNERVVVVDVGGGSTEVVAGMAGEKPEFAHSFNIGCRRATERFFHADPPAAEELSCAREWIRLEMAAYFDSLKKAGYGRARVVAVAGTATSVVSIREKMRVYDSSLVHMSVVSRADIDAIEASLSGMPLEERQKVVGLDPRRAPVIVAGFIVLQEVMSLLGVDSFTVSESDILQGVILRAARE